MVIATTSELFREFEKRYADKIPVVRGDFTPYWEDGAGSSARETAINRTAAERLVQAETLSAMLDPRQYPAAEFADAWRNVILYDEHTWGAHNSITEPDKPFVKDQWKIKQAFALDADAQSRKLLVDRARPRASDGPAAGAVDVFNTSSWPRTDLVVLGEGDERRRRRRHRARRRGGPLAAALDRRVGLPGQRRAGAGRPTIRDRRRQGRDATARRRPSATAVSSPAVSVRVDPASGAIVSLRSAARGRRTVRHEVGRRPESLLLRAWAIA